MYQIHLQPHFSLSCFLKLIQLLSQERLKQADRPDGNWKLHQERRTSGTDGLLRQWRYHDELSDVLCEKQQTRRLVIFSFYSDTIKPVNLLVFI